MRIGINATCIEGNRFGVGRYLINLLQHWASDFSQNQYYLYFREDVPQDDFLKAKCFTKTLVRCPRLFNKSPIWENIFLSKRVGEDEIDIFFAPSYLLPLKLRCKKKVVTIHDISYITHPEWYSLGRRWYYNFMTPPVTKMADMVLTVSMFSKKEIISHLGTEDKKIKVIYEAAEDKFQLIRDKKATEVVKEKYNIKGEYLFYLGLIVNRRNIPTLLLGFQKFFKKTKKNFYLLLAGADRSYPYFNINHLIETMGLKNQVRYVRYIDEGDIVSVYNGASLFVYPSSYEGFGIPTLEAMACGTPVITSNLASLPEVVGDAAYLLNNPKNADELAAAIEKVLLDEKMRAEMILKGLKRVKMFSWEKCAQETMKYFKEIYNS